MDARSHLVRCARLFCFENSRHAAGACSLSLPSLPRLGFMLTSPPTQYIVRLFGWARKYGSLVNLDLHTALGSQNGYNHSVNFLDGVMGYANGRCMLDYIRVLVEFISQHEYKDLVPIFGIANEAYLPGIGRYVLTSLTREVYRLDSGGSHPPCVVVEFISQHDYKDLIPMFGIVNEAYLPGVGRYVLTSLSAFGVPVAGEFNNSYNDCGLYLINRAQHYGGVA
ncbi:hypothetical protein B0H13DRAFT_2685767 [Mycena leptocephala]|nr:hypothetical protein B0H13DRAFT_2685767 [Mycena leptocephala]